MQGIYSYIVYIWPIYSLFCSITLAASLFNNDDFSSVKLKLCKGGRCSCIGGGVPLLISDSCLSSLRLSFLVIDSLRINGTFGNGGELICKSLSCEISKTVLVWYYSLVSPNLDQLEWNCCHLLGISTQKCS